MSTGFQHKSILAAGVIIIAAIAVASIALMNTRSASPPPDAVPPPSAGGGHGNLRWLDDPRPVPATAFADEAGTTLTLQDFAGRVLVANFWATWCPPCIEEMPTLDALQAALGGDDFAVLAINQDRGGVRAAKPFVKANEWENLTLYLEPQARFAKDAALRGLPTSLIIDREGREVARLEGTTNWNSPEMIATLRKLVAGP